MMELSLKGMTNKEISLALAQGENLDHMAQNSFFDLLPWVKENDSCDWRIFKLDRRSLWNCEIEDLEKAQKALEILSKPMETGMIKELLLKIRLKTSHKEKDGNIIDLQDQIYIEFLQKYPFDAVAKLDQVEFGWFPNTKELEKHLLKTCKKRLYLMKEVQMALKRASNKNLKQFIRKC